MVASYVALLLGCLVKDNHVCNEFCLPLHGDK